MCSKQRLSSTRWSVYDSENLSPECPAWHMEKYPKDLPRQLPLPKGTNREVSNMVEITAITGQENCCQIKTTRHTV